MAFQGNVVVSSATTLTLTNTSNIFVFNGAAAATWTMPALTGNSGLILWCYNRGSAIVAINRAGSDQFYSQGSAVTSLSMPPGARIKIMDDGGYWLTSTEVTIVPTFDNAAVSAYQNATASGTPITHSHTVGAGLPYGLVCVHSQNAYLLPPTATAVVTFGGVTLAPLGYLPTGIIGIWLWVFGGNNIPAGAQTVSVTLTQAGQVFYGHTASYTYQNVAVAAAFVTDQNNSFAPPLSLFVNAPRTSPNPGRLWVGAMATPGSANALTSISAVQRQLVTGGGSYFVYGGDIGVCGTEVVNVDSLINGTGVAVAAVDLIGATPTGPYLTSFNYGKNGIANDTWKMTCPAGSDVFAMFSGASYCTVSSITYDGTAMSSVGLVWMNDDATGASGVVQLYRISNVSGGSKTIALTVNGSSGWSCGTVACKNVVSVGTVAHVHGNATDQSQTVTCAANQMILQGFGGSTLQLTQTDTSFNLFIGEGYFGGGSLTMAHSPVSTTFTANTGAYGATKYGGLAVVLS